MGESDFDAGLIKGVTVSRDFRLAHLELVKHFQELSASYKRMFPMRDIIITCTFRSP